MDTRPPTYLAVGILHASRYLGTRILIKDEELHYCWPHTFLIIGTEILDGSERRIPGRWKQPAASWVDQKETSSLQPFVFN